MSAIRKVVETTATSSDYLDPVQLGNEFSAILERLGQIVAGLRMIPAEQLPARAAGFGSIVIAKNVATGEIRQYMLMVRSLLNMTANQVSLASPIGQALLGGRVGDEVITQTPQGTLQLRILRVKTLADVLAEISR